MDTKIIKRIASLRSLMKKKHLSAFIIPSTDPHSGEYVPEYWKTRQWISGFSGSAGIIVITLYKGGLWTDSRYFLQAEEQLKGSGIKLFKDRMPETPSISDWLGSELNPHDKIGIDGWVNTYEEAALLQSALATYNLELVPTNDIFNEIWTNRPPLPNNHPFILPMEYAGRPVSDKLSTIRHCIAENHADGILISALDEIAWILNMRGNDVHCNPVFISYLIITFDNATLYISPAKTTPEIRDYLKRNSIQIKNYDQIESDIKHYTGNCIQLPPETNYILYKAAQANTMIVKKPSPACLLKAIKNPIEINGFYRAMKRDGVAMVRFLMWLEHAIKSEKETEISISQKLYAFRAQQELFQGISFDTIAGYQEHGAIVHYEATTETASTLKPEGFLLLDSGAQYTDGTTDITRTIALGTVSKTQCIDYTLVLKGFIALSQAEFPQGTCGTQLDILARQFMWKAGINYGHGTGHGVGHFLNVHEGPHQIRMNNVPTPLQPGMIITNEPGIYKTGQYGIRTENTMLVVAGRTTEFGSFYKFEPLTLCPIDKTPICLEMMSSDEKTWLNTYHKKVYQQLAPLLTTEEQIWLGKATSEI